MRAFIDTNIFVYATYTKYRQFQPAIDFLKKCQKVKDSWYISWGVIYEYLRVVTHPMLFSEERLPLPKALENVKKFCSFPNVEVLQETDHHTHFLQELTDKMQPLTGNILHDAHSVTLMKEHDVKRIYTADTDFHRFPDVEAVNPVQ